MLTKEATKTIESYLNLPLGTGVTTPYFNNRRTKIRAGLRALIGKGSPEEIVDEAHIIALRKKIDVNSMTKEDLSRFLVDHHIGIDCSGLAYHILDAECREKTGAPLRKYLRFSLSPLRRLVLPLRTAEQVSVTVLSENENSYPVSQKEARPGDIIVLLSDDYNHVLVVENVEHKNNITILHYVHSFAWRDEGRYGHGVRRGTLKISDENLLGGEWLENNHLVSFQNIRQIKTAQIRRLKAFA